MSSWKVMLLKCRGVCSLCVFGIKCASSDAGILRCPVVRKLSRSFINFKLLGKGPCTFKCKKYNYSNFNLVHMFNVYIFHFFFIPSHHSTTHKIIHTLMIKVTVIKWSPCEGCMPIPLTPITRMRIVVDASHTFSINSTQKLDKVLCVSIVVRIEAQKCAASIAARLAVEK